MNVSDIKNIKQILDDNESNIQFMGLRKMILDESKRVQYHFSESRKLYIG